MNQNVLRAPDGFAWGYTPITRIDGGDPEIAIDFGILRLREGEEHDFTGEREGAVLLMDGRITLSFDSTRRTLERHSLFDEEPCAVHFAAGAGVRARAESACELAVSRVRPAPGERFATRLFEPRDLLESEHRGKGLLDGTAYRIVRTIFDRRNRPEGNLVLGEVINFPGRWSSYPPHHHPQPELYHYRFTRPEGYGHAELGEEVHRVRQNDTLVIRPDRDHPQVAAPGYGMYYIWVIRHLPGNPYGTPEFTQEHRWANDPGSRYWKPRLNE